jgi:NarL family two-component system response regulator YdfI
MVEIAIMSQSGARKDWLLRVIAEDRTIHVNGIVATFPALRSLISQRPPDVAVIDSQSQSDSRFEREWVIDLLDVVPLILLSAEPHPAILNRLQHTGAGGILQENPSSEQIRHSIQAVAHGLVVLDTALAPGRRVEDAAEQLTARELDVLRLLAEGSGNREIALYLKISEHTIKFHISSILGKLGVSSRTEAVSRGLRSGLIEL